MQKVRERRWPEGRNDGHFGRFGEAPLHHPSRWPGKIYALAARVIDHFRNRRFALFQREEIDPRHFLAECADVEISLDFPQFSY